MTGQVGFALAALACVLVADVLGRRLRVPSAVLLVLVGLAYGLAPGSNVRLDPTVVLTLVIPPLLYSTALRASLLEIRSHVRTVASLSVGLVLATTFAVAGLLVLAVPGLPFSVAVALGAAVSPPDPVAALAIGRRAGLPTRLITLVEGEGLLNDATALTTYQVALGTAAGSGVTALGVAGSLVLEVSVGLLVGLAVAFAVRELRRHITDPLVDNGLSLGIPLLSYTLAHALHGSGVLAVVVAGLVIGHSSSQISTGASRLQTRAVWRLVDFLLEGFVFLLIGQQLPKVVDGLGSYRIITLVAAAGIAVGVTVALRPIWLLVSTHLPGRLRGTSDVLRAKEVLALSWVGTRGVITLAAVFGLPLTLHGQALPRRDLLLFCAYAVVLVTLVGQGLTFGPLLGRLGLPTVARRRSGPGSRPGWRPHRLVPSGSRRSSPMRRCRPRSRSRPAGRPRYTSPAAPRRWTASVTATRTSRAATWRGCAGCSSIPSARSCCAGATPGGSQTAACARLTASSTSRRGGRAELRYEWWSKSIAL